MILLFEFQDLDGEFSAGIFRSLLCEVRHG